MRFVVSSLLAAGLVATASAGTLKTFETVIEYDRDLLTVESGAKIVFDQIVSTAKRECEPKHTSVLERLVRHNDDCVNSIITQAVKKIDAPLLSKQLAESRYATGMATAQ